MGKYRKKPIIVEAEIYKPGMEDGFSCTMESMCTEKCKTCEFKMPYIETLEGKLYISSGDYIVTGVKAERYPCKPDIFEMTYEKIETSGKTEESKTANKFQCAKWIRTSEELPEINEKVIIRTQHTITIAYLRESDFYDEPMYFQDELSGNWDIEEVTHWMPLPEPPKDVEYER